MGPCCCLDDACGGQGGVCADIACGVGAARGHLATHFGDMKADS